MLVGFIGMLCCNHWTVLSLKFKMIPMGSRTFLPMMMSYLQLGESKTSAWMSDICLLPNSGNFIPSSFTTSLVQYAPCVVVVLFSGPFIGCTPKGKDDLLIRVPELPESRRTSNVLCMCCP